jgi:hypothetical protein
VENDSEVKSAGEVRSDDGKDGQMSFRKQKIDKAGHRVAAETIAFFWRRCGGMISAKLDVI